MHCKNSVEYQNEDKEKDCCQMCRILSDFLFID